MDFEDDPVVQRIPVIMSKGMSGRLFLYEYKRMPVESTNESKVKVIKSRIKPKQQKIEVHVEMDKRSQNFNPAQARKLLPKSKNIADLGCTMVETQVLSSSTSISKNIDRFAVGVVHRNDSGQQEIHLNPLHGMLSLKHNYDYMDAVDKKSDQEKKQAEESGGDSLNNAAAAKPITVRFARQDPKRLKMAQNKSLAAQQRIKDEEPWCETEFYPENSSESKREKERLVCDQLESNAASILVDPPETFLPVLCPHQLPSVSEARPVIGPLSSEDIAKLPFFDQVAERMKQAHVISFSKLKMYLDPRKSDSDIISALQRVAVPVRGNWVVNSEQIFRPDFSSISGVSAERLCHGRDHVLYMFSQSSSLKQADIAEATKLPPGDIVAILKKLACQVKSEGWKFKLTEDDEFIKSHPEEVDRLFKRFEMKVRNVERRAAEERVSAGASTPTKKAKGAPRQRKTSTKSRKDSHSSDH